jgi:hypothetical protein
MKTNLSEWRKDFERRAIACLEELGETIQDTLTEEVRDYPRETKRRYGRGKTGKLAGSPRDVVDSGDLVDSYELTIKPLAHGIRGIYAWHTDHAAIVWAGTSKIPPYPFTRIGTDNFSFEETFNDS